jgi:hypothetical protein
MSFLVDRNPWFGREYSQETIEKIRRNSNK